ncbi:hypothetical protein AWC18_00155 [Mycolicibacter nonchromogenicus]|uniref:DUF4345 domain-containing protein n=1 Tax=Mycolicibacter nonchromogenicus TaxID=1782 RepID=A0A1X1ZSI5_MYCNO|nr:DUF4345 domain-containing protein [Mycolicibacter nonchromogenicus]ORW26330.1 hypothetical protein AWC18_00155 [Mycolicibacter nonchromogenicus]
MVIRSLRVFGWLTGLLLIGIGISRMAFSLDSIPGGQAVNPTVDSETRAAGALLIGFGVGYLETFRRFPIPATAVRLLAAVMALLGLSRLMSMADVGMPHPVFTAACAVEFVAAGLTYWYASLAKHIEPRGTVTVGTPPGTHPLP